MYTPRAQAKKKHSQGPRRKESPGLESGAAQARATSSRLSRWAYRGESCLCSLPARGDQASETRLEEPIPKLLKQPLTRPISEAELVAEVKGIDQASATQPEEPIPKLLKQPDTRPITPRRSSFPRVKGIYAGLVMVEGKCIEVDNKQAAALEEGKPESHSRLNDEQWQALIALHRTLLHEHHDFFLASQHPSASAALRQAGHQVRHAGAHVAPRHPLVPGAACATGFRARLDHMLSFIYLAYSMMALLYETVHGL